MSEWKYVRTNSKGKKIYRRDTNESLEFVLDYLEKKELPHEPCKVAGFSKGIDDFVTNHLNADASQQIALRFEDSHIACYSYPNCDIAPEGCVVVNGDYAEPYGHRD